MHRHIDRQLERIDAAFGLGVERRRQGVEQDHLGDPLSGRSQLTRDLKGGLGAGRVAGQDIGTGRLVAADVADVLGRHLLDIGMKPGPPMGEVLRAVYELQLDGKVTDLESAITAARTLIPDQARPGERT